MANAYNSKVALLKNLQDETINHIEAIESDVAEAFAHVETKGGTIPTADQQTLGTQLNEAIDSIPTNNMPIDDESEESYFGFDEERGAYICSNIADRTDVGFGRDSEGIYSRNQEEDEEDE